MTRVAIAVMRLQPLHAGHIKLISKMIRQHTNTIIGIGSIQECRTSINPWTFNERRLMLKNVFHEQVKIVPLKDLGTSIHTNQWVEFVISETAKTGLPTPTDYFSGSEEDSIWYKSYFSTNGKKLHIIDRTLEPTPDGGDLRTFITLGNDEWKKWTPKVNWEIIENNYPEKLKITHLNNT